MAKDKKVKRELAAKKAKQKRNIIIAICAVIALLLVAAVIFNAVQSARTEVYTRGNASITLRPNGEFTAILFHGERLSGTYVKSEDSVAFTHIGTTVIGELEGNTLHLPEEWDDGHGHGYIFTKR